MQSHWSNLLEASVVAIRTSLSNQASKLIAKIMPAQPGPWHGVVLGMPWSIPLQALSQSCLMVVMMMMAQRWLIEVECTVGEDDDYYDFHREGGSELLIGLKCTGIEIECMRREE